MDLEDEILELQQLHVKTNLRIARVEKKLKSPVVQRDNSKKKMLQAELLRLTRKQEAQVAKFQMYS